MIKPRTVCMDGVSLSIQDSSGHYCLPRESNVFHVAVEVGYPENEEGSPFAMPDEWKEYQDGDFQVFAYVPVGLVAEFIHKHGGIKE